VTTRAITFVGYGVILVAAGAWAVAATRHPNWMTLPETWVAATRRRPVRVAIVIGWIWLGWHLFARGSGAFD
jgi:hypothetical protein